MTHVETIISTWYVNYSIEQDGKGFRIVRYYKRGCSWTKRFPTLEAARDAYKNRASVPLKFR